VLIADPHEKHSTALTQWQLPPGHGAPLRADGELFRQRFSVNVHGLDRWGT